jgi:Methyltransferase domain
VSYADLAGQRGMAFDATRNALYEAAIKRVVTPDSVVLDLGSGLGMHALMAARAGARRVFMVEPENVVHCALEVAKHNGYGDRIEAFQGRIEEVELPEKVDVIISVFTGNLLYTEDLLPSLYFARDKWLKPGGALIPDAAELMVAPINIEKRYSETVEAWSKSAHEFDYSPLRRFAANDFISENRYPSEKSTAYLLAAAKTLATEDFYTAKSIDLDRSAEFSITSEDVCHGLHGWIRIRLGEAWAATGPIDPPMHWTPLTLPVDPPIKVAPGDTLSARVRRPAYGDWTWSLATASAKRQQSSFLGQPVKLKSLALRAATAKPALNQRGKQMLDVLSQMDGTQTTAEIAKILQSRFPRRFEDEKAATRYVSNLAAGFGGDD